MNRIVYILSIFTTFFGLKEAHAQLYVKSAYDSTALANCTVAIPSRSAQFSSDREGKVDITNFNSPLRAVIKLHGFDTLDMTVKPGDIIYLNPRVNLFEPVIYTGSIGEKKHSRDELANVKVIGSRDINASGSQNLGDILKYQPNVQLSNDPVLGTSVSINGMSGQNVKLLKNGAGLSGAMNGSIDVSQLNLNNVEQVEIIEGPMSLLYGSNALAGTINIISKIPGLKRKANLKAYTESSGIYNLNASYSDKIKKLRYGISLGRNFFDGWNPGNTFFYYPVSRNPDLERNTLWKPRRQLFGDMNLYIPLNKHVDLKYNLDFLHETIVNKGKPQTPYFETAFDDYFYTRRNTNSLELNVRNKDTRHNLLASFGVFHRIKNSYIKDLTVIDKGILTSPENQDTTKIYTSQLRYIVGSTFKSIRLNGGFDFNHETFRGKRIYNSTNSIFNVSFVGIASYNYKKKHEFKLGVRQTLHSRSSIPIIPSFSARFALSKFTDLKLSAARGFRTPGIKELYLYFVDINHNIQGNPDLKSESSENLNILLSNKRKHGKNFLFQWQVNAYYNWFKNLISLAAINATEYTYVNIGNSRNRGINSEIGFDFGKLDLRYRNAIISSSNNLSIANSPAFFTTVNHGLILNASPLKKKALKLNAFVNYFGKSPSVSYENNQPILVHTQNYCMIDISATYPLKISKINFNLVGGLRNLNNISNVQTGINNGVAHQSSSGQRLISTGRTLFFSLECTL